MLYPDGTGAVAVVGSDLAGGERPQLFVPRGTFHTSRLAPGDSGYALLASTEWPGVEPPDVEHADIEELIILGLARTTTFSHTYRRKFERLREEAEERGMGLWSACPDTIIY
jgi:predicted cupin superfamily sugar epimerase